MLPYPPHPKPAATQNSLLRALGGVLAVLSILLAVFGIILHQRVLDLIFAIIVGLLALRILFLWLGYKPQHQQPVPGLPSMGQGIYPPQAPPFPVGQYAPYSSPTSQSQPLYQPVAEQYLNQTVPIPPAAAAPTPPKLPRSIRPQRPSQAPAFPAQYVSPDQETGPIPPSAPSSAWPSPQYPPMPKPSPEPQTRPFQRRSWQYDDGGNVTQQWRDNDA